VPEYYRRSFNRYEYKYLLPIRRVDAFVADIGPFMAPDPHSGPDGYRVYSVYWDSSDLRCFWEKVEGLKDRRKVRFRSYEPGGEVFVEIKQRTDRTIQKRRVRWPAERVEAVLGWERNPEAGDEAAGDPVASEVLCLRYRERLVPRMAVQYRRRAFFGLFEPDLRITFDTRIQYSHRHLAMNQPLACGPYMVDPRLTVVEIKFDDRVPKWLIHTVERHELALERLSKYCRAIDLEFYENRVT